MMQLSVRLVPVDDATLVVALTGELDSTTRPVLAAFLDPLPRSPVKYVLVAAGDLWFCDLNGLEQFASTHGALQAKGGHLAIAEAQPALRRLIGLMAEHACAAMPVFASMAEALAAAGVVEYQTPALLPAGHRHLPRLRSVPRIQPAVRDRPRPARELPPGRSETDPPRPPAGPGNGPHGNGSHGNGSPGNGSLPAIIHQSRTLCEQAVHQQQTLAEQLAAAARARMLLISARERCNDSLGALRANLTHARWALEPRCASSARPRLPRPGP
ncbi:STAS domain-containing protein [Nonomuraea sp. NPDC049709]|uniref:STAS domain-containing protein n=1 Tax=Nonomuraea sp. NPDC049709 TaxID=3154736 RepID=UPI00342675B1